MGGRKHEHQLLFIPLVSFIISLLLPALTLGLSFDDVDLEKASESELEDLRQSLSQQLERVLNMAEKGAARLQSKSFSPLSASLPNRESPTFLQRLNALTATKFVLENSLYENATDSSSVDATGRDSIAVEETSVIINTTTSTITTTTMSPISLTEPMTTPDPSESLTLEGTSMTLEAGDRNTTTTVPSETSPLTETTKQVTETTSEVQNSSIPPTTSTTPPTTPETTLESTTSTTTTTTTSTPQTSGSRRQVAPQADEPRLPPGRRPLRRQPFNPTKNHTEEECRQLTQKELVKELKQKGTYNPDLMAWDVLGVLRFLDRTITDQYEMQIKKKSRESEVTERNVDALARILQELGIQCDDVRSERIRQRMHNLTILKSALMLRTEPRRTISSPSLRHRFKRDAADILIKELSRLIGNNIWSNSTSERTETSEKGAARNSTTGSPFTSSSAAPPSHHSSNTTTAPLYEGFGKKQKFIGDNHVVPFGCDRRGTQEDGYLRLCSACQSIRRLPDSFFPPFINEVTCDEDNSCLYFYNYPHGRCRQKHMNFVVLRNVGTPDCQVWKKFNLNVRVSCECFVDEMSFFAKYV